MVLFSQLHKNMGNSSEKLKLAAADETNHEYQVTPLCLPMVTILAIAGIIPGWQFSTPGKGCKCNVQRTDRATTTG